MAAKMEAIIARAGAHGCNSVMVSIKLKEVWLLFLHFCSKILSSFFMFGALNGRKSFLLRAAVLQPREKGKGNPHKHAGGVSDMDKKQKMHRYLVAPVVQAKLICTHYLYLSSKKRTV